MDILVTDLHEDGAGLREEIARDRETVAKIGEVAMDPVTPRVTERLDLFRLASDVASVAVFDVATGCTPLEIAVELDAVGRVEVNALDLAAQALTLGQAGHDL